MGTEHSVHRGRGVAACDISVPLKQRNNYHPLRFHAVHGDNIKLSRNGTVACRAEGFCKGIVFSNRPVMVFERIHVKFLDTFPNWSGSLRIGFTMNDPLSMKSKLPRFAIPHLVNIHGNWAKAVADKLAKKDTVLFYYVDLNGDVHYGIGAEEYGVLFGGVNVSGKIWAVLDIYGNTAAVEFVDPGSDQESPSDSESDFRVEIRSLLERSNLISDISFHSVHGKNLTLKRNATLATRKTGSHSHVYAFTSRFVRIGEKIIMRIIQTDYIDDILVYGVTSCNPSSLDPSELPENAYDLMDRPEYWIIRQESYYFKDGDYIIFSINSRGELTVVLNDTDILTMFYIDHTQKLWLFFNLTHSVTALELLGSSSHNNPDVLLEGLFNLHLGSITSERNMSNAAVACVQTDDLKNVNLINSASENAQPGPSRSQFLNECIICYEKTVDSALYRCGHMCMCYNCALKLWNSENSQCPICRESICDVLKIFK